MNRFAVLLMILTSMVTENLANMDGNTIRTINSLVSSLKRQRESELITMNVLKKVALNYEDVDDKVQIYREILGYVLDKYVVGNNNKKDGNREAVEKTEKFHFYKDGSNKLLASLKKLVKSKQNKEKEFVLNHQSPEEEKKLNKTKLKNNENQDKAELEMLDQIYNHLEKFASELKVKNDSSENSRRAAEPK